MDSVERGEAFARELIHAEEKRKYDPVKRREYYLRTRKLKGRKKRIQDRSLDTNRQKADRFKLTKDFRDKEGSKDFDAAKAVAKSNRGVAIVKLQREHSAVEAKMQRAYNAMRILQERMNAEKDPEKFRKLVDTYEKVSDQFSEQSKKAARIRQKIIDKEIEPLDLTKANNPNPRKK